MFDNNNWLLLLGLCCAIPALFFLVAGVWVIQRGQSLLIPDTASLATSYAGLKAKNPTLPTEKLVAKIVHQQAVRAGLIGAVTSVGGLLTLPIGLGIDLFASARVQNATLFFIAQAFGAEGRIPIIGLNDALSMRVEGAARNFLIARGEQVARRMTQRLLVIIAEKSIAKIIPGIGLLIGFAVNYAIARGISEIAVRYYSGQISALAKTGVARLPGD